jgi:hypothetical protein
MCVDTQIAIEEAIDTGKCSFDGSQCGHETWHRIGLERVLSNNRCDPLI